MENNDVLDAEHCISPKTVDCYVVMYRYGKDFWSPSAGFSSLESALKNVIPDVNIVDAWKIVRVSGLPVEAPPGEIE